MITVLHHAHRSQYGTLETHIICLFIRCLHGIGGAQSSSSSYPLIFTRPRGPRSGRPCQLVWPRHGHDLSHGGPLRTLLGKARRPQRSQAHSTASQSWHGYYKRPSRLCPSARAHRIHTHYQRYDLRVLLRIHYPRGNPNAASPNGLGPRTLIRCQPRWVPLGSHDWRLHR